MKNDHEPTVNELFDLSAKTALVTGGTGWLGSAFCRALAEAGAEVVISSSRSAGVAQAAADKLASPSGARHHGVELDHMDEDSIRQGFHASIEAAGQLDILVNNGLDAIGNDLTDVTHEAFARHQMNNAGYFVLARLTRNHAVQRGTGASIINIGSMYGLLPRRL